MRLTRCALRSDWLSLTLAALAVLVHAGIACAQHPFLIVDPAEYDSLRALSASGPWATMKSSAISYVNSHSYSESASFDTRIDRMYNLTGSGALAYILDPSNKAAYVGKMKTALAGWEAIRGELVDGDFDSCVQGGSAFLYATLALDVIRDELTVTERESIETNMQQVADWFYTTVRDHWPPNAAAVFGSWATYSGDAARMTEAAAEYRNSFETQFNSQGVFTSGPGYAWARFAGDRVTKAYYMDVLDHSGQDSYYDDPRAIGMNEWLYGGAVTPMRRLPTFGDTDMGRWAGFGNPAQWRAGRFSELAAANSAWLSSSASDASLLAYVALQDRPPMEQPKSRIWTGGYAAFWQEPLAPKGTITYQTMAGYLWTPTHEDNVAGGHAHSDVNALHLCAYGENVLVNSGYAGYGEGISGAGWTQSYTWNWIHEQAESNNTVLVGGRNHSSQLGGGVTEGFTGGRLDYASGNDGPALSNSTHQRNFIFVHPGGGANGYWVLFDEISTNTSYTTAQVLLHPNSKTISTTTANQEYRAAMNGLVYGYGSGVALNMFLATAPTSVTIKKGGVAAFDDKSFEGEYLYSTYTLSGSPKKKNVVTVLFPEDSTHAKATMTRITATGITGASITQGNVADYAFESDGTTTRSYNGVSFRGQATMYRLNDGELDFFFVRKGRSFNDGQTQREGFDSDAVVSLFMEELNGSIISPGTDVTFYYPGIVGLKLDGQSASILGSGTDWIRVAVPSGTWQAEYIPDNYAPVAVADAFGASEDVALVVGPVGVLANDTDDHNAPADLAAYKVTDPLHGTLELDENGGITYTPQADYHGPDSFTYRAFDGKLYSDPATVNIDVVSVNDAPAAVGESYRCNPGTPKILYNFEGVLLNDTDPDNLDSDPDNDDVLTTKPGTGPSHGVLEWYSGGAFKYTPAAGFEGIDSFTYYVSDGEADSALATVVIRVMDRIPGDADDNGAVDALDAAILATNWGHAVTKGASAGDFNADGLVNAADAAILAANWSPAAEETSAVPEPATMLLLAVGAMALLVGRRGRAAGSIPQ